MLLLKKLITFLIFVHSSKTTYNKKQKEYIFIIYKCLNHLTNNLDVRLVVLNVKH